MKTFYELQEGLNDPNIFKAFFLAGGPGSGKSYVVRKTTGGTGLKVVNSDDAFEKLLKDAGLSLKMPADEAEPRDAVRGKAKALTSKSKGNYLDGRLGLVIDGTGRDYDKVSKEKKDLENLGYDCYMIFVNTSLDVALERNIERERSVPEDIVIKSWKDVQSNIGKFNNLFKSGMIIVDNNKADEDIIVSVFKRIKSLLKNKVTNSRAKQWVSFEMKRRGITKRPKGF
jgi:dephospho-CoA kinase|tara:strand:+ start:1741 stop:2424 length:684 start_codon:yes stop_codon:yes gene_type:complete